VDNIKFAGTPKAYEKSRLVVQAYNDNDKKTVLTQGPTIQRVSQLLILCLAVSIQGLNIYLRDISQAYTQSHTFLVRDFYVRPPQELNLPPGVLLKVLRPLYGIPEAGTHWFRTYHSHHTEKLKLQQASYDPCLLFTAKSDKDQTQAIVGLQTDDTLFAGNTVFKDKEQEELEKAQFPAKPLQKLTTSSPLEFNGATLTKTSTGSITISQSWQVKKITLIDTDNATREQYITQRARAAYIATVCHPQVAFGLSYAAQSTDSIPTKDDVTKLNKCLKWQMDNQDYGLTFVKLDVKTLKLVVFTDSSFANNKDYSSQIGYVIVLADGYNNCNLIHWSSIKCRRVTRSVIASELYAMGHGFDYACVLKHTLDNILHTSNGIPITICIDSFSLYECLVKLGTTNEKRLMIDLMTIRQAYERREISEVIWIKGDHNPADTMTKHDGNKALKRIIESNKLHMEMAGWVERESTMQTAE